jgi:Fic-DOC domain mobile mystery protein B
MSEESDGTTSLDSDEMDGLIPPITTREELNTFESANILRAMHWARTSRKLRRELLSVDSLKLLHARMFDQTWSWAGKFRLSDKNIGAHWTEISSQMLLMCRDINYWIDNEVFPFAHIAVRFHHKLVSIHPFANGNGRHSRLAADLLMQYRRNPVFSWGGSTLDVEGATRRAYISALQMADKGSYEELLSFATKP